MKRFGGVAGGVGWRRRGNLRAQYQVAVMAMVTASRIAGTGNGHNVVCADGGLRSTSRSRIAGVRNG